MIDRVRRAGGRVERHARAGARWARLLASRRTPADLRVSYGHDRVPGPGEAVAGGTAKLQKLQERFPNHPADFSLLYLGSSGLPRDLRPLLWATRRRGAAVVVNQDGVGYPGWAGARADEVNRPLRQALRAADHVLYQSEFCKRSADAFLGEPRGRWEILHNAVDTDRFAPADMLPADGPVLLLGGDQTQAYRLELALRTLAVVRHAHPEARLVVAGRLVSPLEPLASELGLADAVSVTGRYSQAAAPDLYRGAHLLLHTKVNDPCPNVVLEAMACGLPVVYPASGGTVELVGEEAGVGVPHTDGFERDEPPSPDALAAAVDEALRDRERLAGAARRRAVELFPLPPWLDRHAELFADLLAARRPAV